MCYTHWKSFQEITYLFSVQETWLQSMKGKQKEDSRCCNQCAGSGLFLGQGLCPHQERRERFRCTGPWWTNAPNGPSIYTPYDFCWIWKEHGRIPSDEQRSKKKSFKHLKRCLSCSHDTQKRRSMYDRELYAIVWSIRHLKHYLRDIHFTINTDHKPLVGLQKLPAGNERHTRWA